MSTSTALSFSVKLSTCLATRIPPGNSLNGGLRAPPIPPSARDAPAEPGRPPVTRFVHKLSASGALERRRQCAASQDPDEVTAEIGGAALIADRPRRLDGELRRPRDLLGRQRLAFQRLLGCGCPDRRRRDRGQRD